LALVDFLLVAEVAVKPILRLILLEVLAAAVKVDPEPHQHVIQQQELQTLVAAAAAAAHMAPTLLAAVQVDPV
jgi:hypothetical protein